MKKIFKLLLLGTLFVALAVNALAQTTADDVISVARKYIGTPYRAAGRTPKGFDCSGFTRYVYSHFGFDLSGSAPGQWHHGRSVSRSELQRGDLVFFGGRRHSRSIGHVGIVTEVYPDKGTFDFIHSSSTGVRISASTEAYYKNRYVGARRLLGNEPATKKNSSSATTDYSSGPVESGTVDVYSPSKQKQQPSKINKPPVLSATERQRHEDIARDNAIRDSINAMFSRSNEYRTQELTPTAEASEFDDEE
ncbi:MAG: C40 family peptidase [Bacteroidales bacterium]|nr:C40 family peptidase [Bacteroidales bacterium]